MFKRTLLVGIIFLALLSQCRHPLKTPYKLAFASDSAGNGNILIVDEWGQLSNLTDSIEGDWNPEWSPDGSQLIFTSHRDNQADIWLMDADGGNARNLSSHPAWDYSAAWAPNASEIVFVSERDGDADLFIQGLSQTEAVQLTFNEHQDKLPNWSPRGDIIAFASIINGREQVYLLDLANENAIASLLENDLSGTGPVWGPSGEQLAFIGWEDSAAINIYIYDFAAQSLEKVYTDTAWIGSLNWSSDGQWLIFTGRRNNNHELMALNLSSKALHKLTNNPAWDDFPALRPGDAFQPAEYTESPPSIPGEETASRPKGREADWFFHKKGELGEGNLTGGRRSAVGGLFSGAATESGQAVATAETPFGYGVNLADLGNAYLIQDIGFNAIKGFVNWATIEAAPGEYRWVDPDNILCAAEGAGADVLLRVHGTPDWARPIDTPQSHPPTDREAFARFITALAARYKGRVIAYEIWNEPNLNYEWGYRDPNPAEYAALLKIAYPAIKAGDPTAMLISAGPAPTGDGSPPTVMGDLAFVDGLYAAGAASYFDALGVHLYTYGQPPDAEGGDLTFSRVERQREIMLNYDDIDTPVWITEMGWNIQTHWDLGEYHNQGITELEQAQYIHRAYEKIRAEWPWIEAAYLFNLDFSIAPWYKAAEQMRWYAILNPDRTPRPAYTILRMGE